MKAIIPVAGVGTRMRPHTHTQPKVLLQVADKPMLDHIIDALVEAGVDGVTLVIGYLGDRIEDHVRRHYSHLELHFIEQKEMLGLGHAINLCADIHRNDDRLLIILGDTIVQMDFKGMFALPCGALAVKPVDDPRRFGTVQLEGDRIVKLIEKAENPPSNLAITGVYLIDKPAMLFEGLGHIIANDVKTKGEYQLTDALQYMLDHGDEMRPFSIEGWLDAGKPETLLSTNRTLLDTFWNVRVEKGYKTLYPSAVIVPPVYIGSGAEVTNSVIGPYASIGKECVVDGSILRDCTMAKGAKVKNVHLCDSMLGEYSEVEGSGRSINIGDHSQVTNL